MAQVLLGVIAGPPEWPDLSLGSRPTAYSHEVLVLVAAVMEFLRLRFVVIILMARSPIHHSHADIFPFSCGRDSKLYKALPSDAYIGLSLSKITQ